MENLNTNETPGGADARDCVPRLVRRRGGIKAVASELCRQNGYDPEHLEPGSVYGVDATLPNGDPAFRFWKRYRDDAKKIIATVGAFLPQNEQAEVRGLGTNTKG